MQLVNYDLNDDGVLKASEYAAFKVGEKNETIMLTPFQVSTNQDRGYVAGNTLGSSDFAITDINEAVQRTMDALSRHQFLSTRDSEPKAHESHVRIRRTEEHSSTRRAGAPPEEHRAYQKYHRHKAGAREHLERPSNKLRCLVFIEDALR